MKKTVLLLVSLSSVFIFNGCSSATQNYQLSNARYNATMKPYVRRGEVIQPTEVSYKQNMIGLASWYGPGFQGGTTSSGEKYNMYSYTAAHKTWPMGTLVKVENLKNHKSVIVKINDRGPFVKGRIIDCSYAAAKAIGLNIDGVAPVKLTVIGRS